MPEAYDSTADTLAHIRRVQGLLSEMARELLRRGEVHDDSKLGPDEKPYFDASTPKLRALTYGSPEYKAALDEIGVALKHHYEVNSHHPEHYSNGIDGMDLFDVVEMVCDWKAAGERHADGSIERSLSVNGPRFNIEPQLLSIIANTAARLNWTKPD